STSTTSSAPAARPRSIEASRSNSWPTSTSTATTSSKPYQSSFSQLTMQLVSSPPEKATTAVLLMLHSMHEKWISCTRYACRVDYRFVDCRPRDAYLAGHVPGAAHADPEADLTGTDGGGRHPLPTAEAFAVWASLAGIGPDTLVVAYDEGTGW